MDKIRPASKLVGELAVNKGYCSKQEVRNATAIQKQMAANGETPKMLGLILLEQGYIDNAQFIDLLAELDKLVHDKP